MKGYNQLRGKIGERRHDRTAATAVPLSTPPYSGGGSPASSRGRADKPAPASRRTFEVNKKLLIVAIALSAVASLLAMSYLQSSAGVLSQRSQLVPVVVATRDIPARTLLKADMFGVRDVPATYLVQGAIVPRDDFLGKVSTSPIYAGEQVLKQRVSLPNAKTGITSSIPAGQRALTIDVSAASGLAGLVKPGDFIDLISTIRDPYSPDRVITTPILQRIKVLAVGSRVSGESGVEQDASEGNSAGQTVTLAVPDEKVNLITMLEARGNLKIVLRSAEDTGIVPSTFSDVELEQMLLGQKRLPATPPPELPPTPQPKPSVAARPYIPPSRPAAPRVARAPSAPRPQVIERKVVVQKVVQVPIPVAQAVQAPPRPAPTRSIEIISGTRVTEHKL